MDDLQARPSYFSPDGDGLRDSTQVTCTPVAVVDSVDVTMIVVALPGGAPQDTLLLAARTASGELLSADWKPAPGDVTDGSYRIDVTADDGSQTATESVTVTVDRTTPSVVLGAVGPNPLSAQQIPLVVPYEVTGDDATTTIEIRSLTELIRTLDVVFGSGADTLFWDGTNADSAAVAGGTYVVRAVAEDFAGNADTARVSVLLDKERPSFSYFVTDSLQTDENPFEFSAIAEDNDVVVGVELSVDGGITWAPVDDLGPPGPEVTFSSTVTLPGSTSTSTRQRLHLRATDEAGNAGTDTVSVAYVDQLPEPVSTTILEGATVADGGTVRLRTVWNLPELNVSANFSPLDNGYNIIRPETSEAVTEGPPGTYTIDYRVTPGNSRASGTYRVGIRAALDGVAAVAATDSIDIDLEALGGPRSSELVRVSANRFDPRAGEIVSVSARTTGDDIEVEVFDLSGQRVRILTGVGFVEWDGRGQDGQAVASGIYVLRVLVDDDEEEIRKVAVVRGGGA